MNTTGQAVKPCPNCDGEIELLSNLQVWLCDLSADHCWPADEWSVDTATDRQEEGD